MRAVDLFCGAGGFSHGAHLAGIDVVAAFDIDPILTSLPVPEKGTKRRRIAFSRDAEEVALLGETLLGDTKAKPGDVGVAAWEDVLERSDDS